MPSGGSCSPRFPLWPLRRCISTRTPPSCRSVLFSLSSGCVCGAGPFWPGSSSSSVVHNLLIFDFLIYQGLILFTERYDCVALLYQHRYFTLLKGTVIYLIIFNYISVFCLFLCFKHRSELELEPPLFSRIRLQPKERLRLHNYGLTYLLLVR